MPEIQLNLNTLVGALKKKGQDNKKNLAFNIAKNQWELCVHLYFSFSPSTCPFLFCIYVNTLVVSSFPVALGSLPWSRDCWLLERVPEWVAVLWGARKEGWEHLTNFNLWPNQGFEPKSPGVKGYCPYFSSEKPFGLRIDGSPWEMVSDWCTAAWNGSVNVCDVHGLVNRASLLWNELLAK